MPAGAAVLTGKREYEAEFPIRRIADQEWEFPLMMDQFDVLGGYLLAAAHWVRLVLGDIYSSLVSTLIGRDGLVLALLLLAGALVATRAQGAVRGFVGVFAATFPKRVYLHPSSLMDGAVFIINRFTKPLFGLITVSLTATVAAFMTAALHTGTGAGSGLAVTNAWWQLSLAVFLIDDFAFYATHYLFHCYKPLWLLHRIHHSAEVLTPLTVHRNHPVTLAVWTPIQSGISGVLQGLAFFLIVGAVSFQAALALVFISKPLHLLAVTLGHSHLWISYGPWLNRIFISPAHHQIHHSSEPGHHNKNHGILLAIWDSLFGTLCLPGQSPPKEFGLAGPDRRIHQGVKAFYLEPLISLAGYLRRSRRRSAPGHQAN
jgi:sterol desaturase/sphingolipid hydroxylase (fatty acid hydroxylase superfamily)